MNSMNEEHENSGRPVRLDCCRRFIYLFIYYLFAILNLSAKRCTCNRKRKVDIR
jgi:hypothetical protein